MWKANFSKQLNSKTLLEVSGWQENAKAAGFQIVSIVVSRMTIKRKPVTLQVSTLSACQQAL